MMNEFSLCGESPFMNEFTLSGATRLAALIVGLVDLPTVASFTCRDASL